MPCWACRDISHGIAIPPDTWAHKITKKTGKVVQMTALSVTGRTLMPVFNVTNDEQGSHVNGISVSVIPYIMYSFLPVAIGVGVG